MTNTYSLPGGGPGTLQTIIRAIFLVAATIGGFFIFAASAAFAFFLILGLIILGAIAFGIFWVRAKLFGKPLRPQASMWSYKPFGSPPVTEKTSRRNTNTDSASKSAKDGPILDAHETADGWSVDHD